MTTHVARLLLAGSFMGLLSSACVHYPPAILGPVSPKPRLNIESRKESIALDLAEAVKDAFVVPADGVYGSDMHVSGWRASLTSAFDNGFSSWFGKTNGRPDLVLKLARTEVFFDDKGSDSAIVVGNGVAARVERVAIVCNVQYQAYLVDGEGKVLAKDLSAVRYSNGTWNRQELVVGAVAMMFEQISQRFFAQPQPASSH